MFKFRALTKAGGLRWGNGKEKLESWVNAGTQGLLPAHFPPPGPGQRLDVRLQGGSGDAGAAPSLDKDFTAFYVPGMCPHKAKDPPDLQTSCSAASWTLLLSLTLRELADNLAIKIIRKLIWA